MSEDANCPACGYIGKGVDFAYHGCLSVLRQRIAALEAEKAEYEREKLKRESQEPVAFRWLGPGKGWRAVYAEPPVPRIDPDWLANVIRTVDGNHTMGAGALAEKIAEAINGRAK